MAIKATIYKAELQISDINRGHYQNYSLTLARHPSETEERLMVRLLAFALNADSALQFTKGLCSDNEPELWLKQMDGRIDLWVDIGQLSEKRIHKACGLAEQMIIYTFHPRQADVWWLQLATTIERYRNLSVIHLAQESEGSPLADLAKRTMQLQVTIQDDHIWLTGSGKDCRIRLLPRLLSEKS